jgi:hypothetical protein
VTVPPADQTDVQFAFLTQVAAFCSGEEDFRFLERVERS